MRKDDNKKQKMKNVTFKFLFSIDLSHHFENKKEKIKKINKIKVFFFLFFFYKKI
jgi:hypothetical protein